MLAFSVLVVAKHVIGMAVTWGSPLILAAAEDDKSGVLAVQMSVLLPHALATLAGTAASDAPVTSDN